MINICECGTTIDKLDMDCRGCGEPVYKYKESMPSWFINIVVLSICIALVYIIDGIEKGLM